MQKRLALRLEKARKEPSVGSVNENALREAEGKKDDFLCFGVKDTGRFPGEVFRRVRENENCLWLTVDRMADRGRSIDTGLVNPLTYTPFWLRRCPASCRPVFWRGWAFSRKEILRFPRTDVSLRPSVGVIARTFGILERALPVILDRETGTAKPRPRVAIPRKGDLKTPLNEDMAGKLVPFLQNMEEEFRFESVDMRGAEDRKKGIDLCRGFFAEGFDLILTCEGPVDVLGYGETIPSAFGGIGPELAKGGGKFLLKAVNPFGATAFTVPSHELASGFVVLAPGGAEAAASALLLAKKTAGLVTLPEVFVRYFLTPERMSGGFCVPEGVDK